MGDLGLSGSEIESRIAGQPIVPERYSKRPHGLRGEIERCLGKAKPSHQRREGGQLSNDIVTEDSAAQQFVELLP
jgi:hypothetical protein